MRTRPEGWIVASVALLPVWTGPVLAEEEDREPSPPAYGPVTDQDDAMLAPPGGAADATDFTVATHAPRITFSTMTGLPPLTDKKRLGGLWTVWGEGLEASTGKHYSAVGDHRGVDAKTFLYEYDPATHEHRKVVDVAELIGQKPGDYGHGKIHGRLDETPDGWIYFATYWGGHPDALPPDKLCRIGGRLIRHNARTGETEDLGTPLPGDSFPMHATDTRRGIFHAIGLYGAYVAVDLLEARTLYAGRLPGDVTWDLRSTLIDPKTGFCYGSESHTRRIVGYDPKRNAFFHTNATIPRHPFPKREIKPWIRSYTHRRLPNGSFIVQTYDGVMFKFFPDEQRTEYIGLNWGQGLYSASTALSPDDRYVYYAVGAHGSTWEFGSPIVQMDTTTYTRKVLAFLHPYYQKKHGYVFGGSYSVVLDRKGANLLITWNGRFRHADETGESFGHPAFMYIEIPPNER